MALAITVVTYVWAAHVVGVRDGGDDLRDGPLADVIALLQPPPLPSDRHFGPRPLDALLLYRSCNATQTYTSVLFGWAGASP